MLKLVIVILSIALLAILRVEGQRSLTPQEMSEAVKFAKEFEEQMALHKDVNCFAEKFFLNNFIDRHIGSKSFYAIPNVKRETASNLDRKLLQEYYFSTVNLEYLAAVYYLNKFELERSFYGPPSWKDAYPPNAVDLMKNIYPDGEIQGSPDRIQNEIDLRRYIRVQNQISEIIRAHIKQNSSIYERNIAGLTKSAHRSIYEPWDASDSGAFGLAGSRLILVNTLVFQLLLVDMGNGLRIVNMGTE